jgi:hypothetical protein
MDAHGEDALHRIDYSEFILPGQYLAPLRSHSPIVPLLVVGGGGSPKLWPTVKSID